MRRRTLYRGLLVLVAFLVFLYTLGVAGFIPFRVSYYITLFLILLFVLLRWEGRRGVLR